MDTTPFVWNEPDGSTVTAYRIAFDGRKMTVYGPDGPRTRTRRNRGGYATAAMLRAMGYTDLMVVCPFGTGDEFPCTTLAES